MIIPKLKTVKPTSFHHPTNWMSHSRRLGNYRAPELIMIRVDTPIDIALSIVEDRNWLFEVDGSIHNFVLSYVTLDQHYHRNHFLIYPKANNRRARLPVLITYP